MPRRVPQRLPETKTLYDILPKGVEGGKEFARIVDLLLFHAARREGRKVTVFSDASGDYRGLDSFEGDVFRKQGTVGYQYKFYPSPLSDEHRKSIKAALLKAAANQQRLKLTRWILVTPQDLTEASTRRQGGDVTWFEGLRSELGLAFETEHWGHRKVQGLFLETPALCLFYYPELVPDGGKRRHTIQDTKARYEDAFRELHQRIEFVGMSVYKPEATRGVPMEHIYIPLTAVPEGAAEGGGAAPRANPLSFLDPGGKHVILGDPGSGKSTLMRFLALAGSSAAIQKRYGAKPDPRLPILIILRQYAEELAERRNLPLLQYVSESVQADLSLTGVDSDFLECYLESGQALLLFDGLDELPSPDLKQVVRDRIRSLLAAYPGNTALVTSRIVGYENPFRFGDEEFAHYRLSPLRLPEIEQFVGDWYRVRVDNPQERQSNVDDLVRILRDPAHTAIRELAQNPLLLTIIALVHRIDAVLPDERVVLYQKCTETLLNTWHTWKYRRTEVRQRGRVERRNRQRMEAIAYWMQTQARGSGAGQRAVVPEPDLLTFLSNHISDNERLRNGDDEPRDQAQEFLEFVRRRAGLLIEVGDAKYTFVHLTFQEYLAASHIATQSEKGGADAIWATVGPRRSDPSWHEVIRLLLGVLKSDEAQEFVVGKLLVGMRARPTFGSAWLLGGFLLDGIGAAEERVEEIADALLRAAAITRKADLLRVITQTIRACTLREADTRKAFESTFLRLWKATRDQARHASLILTLVGSGWRLNEIPVSATPAAVGAGRSAWASGLFAGPPSAEGKPQRPAAGWESFRVAMRYAALDSPETNLVAAASPAVALSVGFGEAAWTAFRLALASLASSLDGPFLYLLMHSCFIGSGAFPVAGSLSTVFTPHPRAREGRDRLLDDALTAVLDRRQTIHRAARESAARVPGIERSFELLRAQGLSPGLFSGEPSTFWPDVSGSSRFQQFLTTTLSRWLSLQPPAHWEVALQAAFIPSVPERMVLVNEATWAELRRAFRGGHANDGHVFAAAWLLLLDAGLWLTAGTERPEDSPLHPLTQATQTMDHPALRLSHCIRDLACGRESRLADLTAMVNSRDPAYRRILDDCLWHPRSAKTPRDL